VRPVAPSHAAAPPAAQSAVNAAAVLSAQAQRALQSRLLVSQTPAPATPAASTAAAVIEDAGACLLELPRSRVQAQLHYALPPSLSAPPPDTHPRRCRRRDAATLSGKKRKAGGGLATVLSANVLDCAAIQLITRGAFSIPSSSTLQSVIKDAVIALDKGEPTATELEHI